MYSVIIWYFCYISSPYIQIFTLSSVTHSILPSSLFPCIFLSTPSFCLFSAIMNKTVNMCDFHCLFLSFKYGNTQREPGNSGLAWMAVRRVWPGLLTGASFSAVFNPLPQTAKLQLYLLSDCFLRTARPGTVQVPLCNLSLRHSLLLSCKSHAKLSPAFRLLTGWSEEKKCIFLNEWPYFMHGAFEPGGDFGQSNQVALAS